MSDEPTVLTVNKISILNRMILVKVAKVLFVVVGHAFVNGKNLVFYTNKV